MTPDPRPVSDDMLRQPDRSGNARGGAAILLAFIGLLMLGIGVGMLFGGEWTLVVLGSVLVAFALVLALPSRSLW